MAGKAGGKATNNQSMDCKESSGKQPSGFSDQISSIFGGKYKLKTNHAL